MSISRITVRKMKYAMTCESVHTYLLSIFFFHLIVDFLTIMIMQTERCDLREKKYDRYKFTFINGTAAPAKVDHNTELHGSCIVNFEFEDEYDETPSLFTCNKGNIVLEQRCVPGKDRAIISVCSISRPYFRYELYLNMSRLLPVGYR